MTEVELSGEINFGHGALEFGEEEEWVISEAAGAAGGGEKNALHGTVRGMFNAAVAGGDEYAVIPADALFGRQIAEALQQDHVVPDIGVVGGGIGGVDDSCISSESRRTDARSAAESVDFKTGIVCENEFARCELRIVDSLSCGVRGEGIAVLFGWFDVSQTGKGFDADCVLFSGGAKIAQFALACSGDVQTKTHETSLTAGR